MRVVKSLYVLFGAFLLVVLAANRSIESYINVRHHVSVFEHSTVINGLNYCTDRAGALFKYVFNLDRLATPESEKPEESATEPEAVPQEPPAESVSVPEPVPEAVPETEPEAKPEIPVSEPPVTEAQNAAAPLTEAQPAQSEDRDAAGISERAVTPPAETEAPHPPAPGAEPAATVTDETAAGQEGKVSEPPAPEQSEALQPGAKPETQKPDISPETAEAEPKTETTVAEAKPEPPAPPVEHGPRVIKQSGIMEVKPGDSFLLVGDSLMHDAGWAIERDLRARHLRVTNIGKSSTGFTNREYFDWPWVFKAQVEKQKPAFAVMFVGANDAWEIHQGKKWIKFKTAQWDEIYTSRLKEIIDICREKNIQLIWYEVPAMRKNTYSQKIQHLNDLYRETVSSGGMYFLSTKTVFSDDGSYAGFKKNAKGELKKVRKDDGIHFTMYGANLLSQRLMDRLKFPEPPAKKTAAKKK